MAYAKEAGLPEIPCMFCDYKDCIEFDLELHYLERHRSELINLPIGKGSMDYRAEYAVSITKSRMFNGYKESEVDEDSGSDPEDFEDFEKEDNI